MGFFETRMLLYTYPKVWRKYRGKSIEALECVAKKIITVDKKKQKYLVKRYMM